MIISFIANSGKCYKEGAARFKPFGRESGAAHAEKELLGKEIMELSWEMCVGSGEMKLG